MFFNATGAQADSVNIPGHYSKNTSIEMPHRGMKMNQVLEQFGEPNARKPAVGNPPITEWEYDDFRVYFEYDIVLHSLDLTTLILPK